MDIDKVVKILKVLDLMARMPMVGEGVTRPEIVRWSSVSHSTVYRYLDKMVKIGLVTVEFVDAKKCPPIGYYKITDMGHGYALTDERLI